MLRPFQLGDFMTLSLRDVLESDLEVFFENQLDEGANYMAAFTSPDPSNK